VSHYRHREFMYMYVCTVYVINLGRPNKVICVFMVKQIEM